MLRLSFTLITITLFALSSCDMGEGEYLPEATGKSGDLVVVMDSANWAGDLGYQIKKCFSQPQEGLPQSEPLFNVIQVEPAQFKQIFKTTRNIIIVDRDHIEEKSTYALQNNMWSNNQLVLIIRPGKNKDAPKLISSSCSSISDRFRMEEVNRLNKAFKKLNDAKLSSEVEAYLGVKPFIPTDYKLALKKNDLMWLRKDFEHQGHQVNMGLIMYKRPYTGQTDFNTDSLVQVRNQITTAVSGPVEGSFMKTYEEYRPMEREFGMGETYVKELRGLWNMKGAFMGGPFVQYAFVEPSGQNIVVIDGYVFAPKFDKREYLRELEAIALSAAR